MGSQQGFGGVILEPLFVAHVGAQHIQGFVARLIGHLEDAGARSGGARQKAAPETVAGVAGGIEAHRPGEALDDECDALGGQARAADR